MPNEPTSRGRPAPSGGGPEPWRRSAHTPGGQHPPEPPLEEFWPGYLRDGYFDPAGNLKAEFVLRSKVEPLIKAMADARLTSHQIRRFFQHCRAIEARLKANRTSWGNEEAEFRKLDVAAADAFGKGDTRDPKDRKIPKLFHDFIERNVKTVQTPKDFLKGFLPHFEALVGFGSRHLKEGERGR